MARAVLVLERQKVLLISGGSSAHDIVDEESKEEWIIHFDFIKLVNAQN